MKTWNRYLAKLLASVMFFFGLSTGAVSAPNPITGIYVGSMHLTDGGYVRDIPLSMSLHLTHENAGSQFIIEGQFIVDEEGGPYVFSRVTYDIDNNRFDMKYNRPHADSGAVSFRLVGPFAVGGVISGDVTSGLAGKIGTFKITRNPNLAEITTKQKYIGRWEGVGRLVAQNSNVTIGFKLQPSAGNPVINPVNYELDFTPGRVCGYSMDNITVTSYSNVAIDYLRRQIAMSDTEGRTSVSMKINFTNRTLTGVQNSAMWGVTTQFNNLPEVMQVRSTGF